MNNEQSTSFLVLRPTTYSMRLCSSFLHNDYLKPQIKHSRNERVIIETGTSQMNVSALVAADRYRNLMLLP